MSKRWLISFLLFSIWKCGLTQPVYFDELYGDVPSAQGIGETVRVNDGYLSLCYSYGNLQSYMFVVDTVGNLMFETYFDRPDSISYLSGYIEKINDTLFLGMSLKENLNQPSDERGDFCLIKFDLNGNVHSEWTYGEANHRDIPQSLIKTSDGGYLISGQTQFDAPPDTDGQVYAVKIDSVGNVEWEHEYGGNLYDSGGSSIETLDGGFLLLGWTRSYGAGERDLYLIRIDHSGNEVWFETYGTSTEEIGKSIIQLSDDNYLLTASGTNPSETQSIGRLFKVSPNGDLIWSNSYTYQNNTGHNFHKTVETWNGDLVTVGMTNFGSNAGYLVKTNSLGEVLWQREYDKNGQTDLFYSLLATNDGGFLLSGQAINTTANSQDAWLLKVDSVGCPYPNCTVGIDEKEKTVMVDVWPNPCVDVLNLDFSASQAPLEMTVVDVSGKEIWNSSSLNPSSASGYAIDVSTWPSGVYILSGSDEKGRSFSVKVLKQ